MPSQYKKEYVRSKKPKNLQSMNKVLAKEKKKYLKRSVKKSVKRSVKKNVKRTVKGIIKKKEQDAWYEDVPDKTKSTIMNKVNFRALHFKKIS